MALTFDEFGMWLHLGGSYWQRASFDAVIVLLSIFGLIGFMPRWQDLRGSPFGYHGRFVSRSDFFLPASFQITRSRQR